MKKIYLLFALAFFTTTVSAQKLQWGLRGGVNFLTTHTKKVDATINSEFKLSFHAGAILDINLFDGFYLQPGLYYTGKGGEFKDKTAIIENRPEMGDVKVNLSFIQMPILASYRIPLGNDNVLFHMNAGPYFAVGVGSGSIEDMISKEDAFGSGDEGDLKRFDCGLSLGCGLSVNKFYVGVNHDMGLVNLAKKYTYKLPDKYKNRSWNVSVGITF